MHRALADVRYAARLLLKSRAFTLTASLSIAIGIAASAAIFGLADALLLRPRPGIAAPEGLVDVGRTAARGGFDTISYPNFADYRDRNAVFSGIAAYRVEPQPLSLDADGVVDRVYGTLVSDSYFAVLGTRPSRGRLFVPGEDRVHEPLETAVISDRLWRTRFDSDPAIVGRHIRLNGQPVTVVGVAEPGFLGTTVLASDAWLPLSMQSALTGSDRDMFTNRRIVWLMAFARLQPGVSRAQAQAAMNTVAAQMAREHPEVNRDTGIALTPSHRLPGRLRTPVTMFVMLLGGLVSLVLLIACSNVAGMLLARAAARRRELAVRLAIGSGRAALVRQLLTETVLLFLLGGTAGVAGAAGAIALLNASLPSLPVPVLLDVRLDPRVIAVGLGLALVTGLAFGLLPAVQASRSEILPSLRGDAGSARAGRQRLRGAFVTGQVAMSLVLLVATGLFLRALGRASTIDPGFNAAGVDAVFLDIRMGGYTGERASAFIRQALERLAAEPGIRRAAMAGVLPLGGDGLSFGRITVPGGAADGPGGAIDADWNVVAGDYFGTLEIPILQGRQFSAGEMVETSRVAIVNETLASRLWPGGMAVGQTLVVDAGGETRTLQVVGVARDAKYRWIGEEQRAFVYVPFGQESYSRQTLLLRGANGAAAARRVLKELNPALPVIEAAPLAEYVSQGLLPQRLAAWVAGSLGLVGLFLAALGVYGVTAHAASRRAREIGIRIALGAAPAGVTRLVVWQGLRLALVGAALGLLAAAGVSSLLSSLLFGVGAFDPVAFLGAALALLAATFAASFGPARAAARGNPAAALKAE